MMHVDTVAHSCARPLLYMVIIHEKPPVRRTPPDVGARGASNKVDPGRIIFFDGERHEESQSHDKRTRP